MEGIAGIVYSDVFQVEELIRPMLTSMQHRGKNQDTATVKNFQIGACGRKLQSINNEEIIIALDGALTNQTILRQELDQIGISISPNASDQELILATYEWKGVDCIEKLDGEFAFAILDNQRERIVLARDRIGRKPLYWFNDGKTFLFGSELKALLNSGMVPQTPSLEAIASYLYFGYIPQDLSPMKGVNKLLPGHYLQFNRNRSMSIHSYWSYSSYFENKREQKLDDALDEFNFLIQSSVNCRLSPTRPVGAFLTGGLGSGSTANFLKKLEKKPQVEAFTTCFGGQNEEDMTAAEEMAAALEIPCSAEKITATNLLDDLVKIAWFLDEPIADPMIKGMWTLAKTSSKKVTQVFSGMGSDELLAGHSRYSVEELGGMYTPLMQLKRLAYKLIIPPLHYLAPTQALQLLKEARTDPWEFAYLRNNALLTQFQLEGCSPALAPYFDSEVFLQKFHHLSRIKSKVGSYLYFDVKTRLPDCFVLQVERMTAAHGLDWETPYLDREVVEFLAGLPEPDQLSENETTRFLKSLLQDVFPKPLLDRPKRTRKDFLNPWIQEKEIASVFRLLEKGTLIENNLISPSWLRYQLQNPGTHSFKILFGLLMLEIWFRLNINRPISLTPPEITVTDLLSEFS